jgi:adenylyltransferase/sulfurtransferase
MPVNRTVTRNSGDERYARNIIIKEIGEEGQRKLSGASVLVIGAGGLGAPVIAYLAAAGVGKIGIMDYDEVELSNLQRQILFNTSQLGMGKAQAAGQFVQGINPEIVFDVISSELRTNNAESIIADYDMVVDACDNFETRFLINDTCLKLRKTWVSGAAQTFKGHVTVFKPGNGGCYRCLYPEAPPSGLVPPCSLTGIIGAITGIIGSWQALEVIKEIIGIGDSLAGRMLIIDGLGATARVSKLLKDPECGCTSYTNSA